MSVRNASDIVERERSPIDDGRCFVCGPLNELGLRLVFTPFDEHSVRAITTLAAHFQGWVGFAHGGVVCMMLDDAMAHAAALAHRCGVTAEMNVRFRKPTPLGQPLTIIGRLVEHRKRLLRVAGEIRDVDNVVLASAEGDFLDRGPLDPATLFGRREALQP